MKIDKKLTELLNRHSIPTANYGDMLDAVIKRHNDAKNVVIPVLGMQGMGKSTLLNGLLKADILPNDADETTCVPVEISYGESEYGEVIFSDGKPVEKVYTREELNKYVDNNENPANHKNVERIVLYRNAAILSNGLTLVDLPGVGSITLENERTTKRYIENVATAIFVIPTVPTIRRMEEIFIQGAWSQFSNAMFVQNDWGETRQEILDSVDHNTKLLNNLANRIGSRLNGDIIVVNAFDAIQGALTHNSVQVDKSNISTLENSITSFAADWSKNLDKNLCERATDIIEASIRVAKVKLCEANQSQKEQAEQRKARYEQFRKESREIIDKIEEIEAWLDEKKSDVKSDMRNLISQTIGYIRSDIYKTIDSGVTDGHRLEQAFNDAQNRYIQDFFDEAVDKLRMMAIEYQSKMQLLENKLEIQNDMTFKTEQHSTKSAFKWEKGLDVGGGIAGGVVAFSYAAPLAAFIMSNPGGWVIGAVGIAIAGVISGITYFFKKIVSGSRAAEAKRKINDPIEKIESRLLKQIIDKVKEFFDSAYDLLNQLREDQERAVNELRCQSRETDSSESVEILEREIRFLEESVKEYSIH